VISTEQERIRSWLRDRAFPASPPAVPRVGAEIEWIAVDALTAGPAPVRTRLYPLMAGIARRERWSEASSTKGVPRFVLPGGGCITFEPGGQIEYAAPPFTSATRLLRDLTRVTATLRQAAETSGIALLDAGIDPINSIHDVPLQLHADRYRRMDSYFSLRGVAGARMMRQTAAIQVMPIVVFNLREAGTISRVVLGEPIGTTVSN
jgi:glutamate--cysteine ligase